VTALSTAGLTHTYGALTALDGITLEVPEGGRHAIVGANGAGKTTLLGLVAGTIRPPTAGRITLAGRDITRLDPARRARAGIARTFQTPQLVDTATALDNLVLAGWRHTTRRAGWAPARYRRLAATARRQLTDLGLDACAGRPAGALAHGQRRLLEIGVALAAHPRLLLLDEPAAGLGPEDRARPAGGTVEPDGFEDHLTGLANRAKFDDRLTRALADPGRVGRLAVLLLDLDDFKPINDRYGHSAGDAVLQAVAARLHGCVGEADLVARVGGDEFAIVLADQLDGTAVAERIGRALCEPYAFNGARLTVSVSIGMAYDHGGRCDVHQLLREADAAMYLAKRDGKDRYTTVGQPDGGAAQVASPSLLGSPAD
jgi:diguanylate cyclase (GGDEF)-like protein